MIRTGGARLALVILAAGCGRSGFKTPPPEDASVPPDDLTLDAPVDFAPPPDLRPPCRIPDSNKPLFASPLKSLVRDSSYDVTTADFNGDGRLDVLVAGGGFARATVLLNQGGGQLSGGMEFINFFGFVSSFHSVAAGDLDGDGKMDVAATWVGQRGQVAVYRGHGDGTFDDEVNYALPYVPFLAGLAIVDANLDGDPDIVTAGGWNLYEFVNRGKGLFDVGIPWLASRGSAFGMVTADLNRDGRPDFVVTDWQAGEVGVLVGQKMPGIYNALQQFPAGTSPWSLAAGDLDGDGAPDVAVMDHANAGSLALLHGRGDGTFDPPERLQAGFQPSGVAIGDVDGDGLADVVCGTGVVSVYWNRGGRRFELRETFGVAEALTLADMNGDGRLDLVTVWGGIVSVYLNQSPGCL